MLLRLISVIALIKFLLLMISGMDTATALYRSLVVFMLLFTIVYLTIFFLNVIRDNPHEKKSSTVPNMNSTSEESEE